MLEMFKKDPSRTFRPLKPLAKPWEEDEERTRRIRCPQCAFEPSASTVWSCQGEGTPEPMFRGCGTVWNTFSTRGKCPGCSHQWRWTSCPRCDQWSLHEDWYLDE